MSMYASEFPYASEHGEGWRLYLLLALFDTRDGSPIGDLVHAAREGYERAESEEDAWADFDRIWLGYTSAERLALVRSRNVNRAELIDRVASMLWTFDGAENVPANEREATREAYRARAHVLARIFAEAQGTHSAERECGERP